MNPLLPSSYVSRRGEAASAADSPLIPRHLTPSWSPTHWAPCGWGAAPALRGEGPADPESRDQENLQSARML
mgnify:CR=1 FL=1